MNLKNTPTIIIALVVAVVGSFAIELVARRFEVGSSYKTLTVRTLDNIAQSGSGPHHNLLRSIKRSFPDDYKTLLQKVVEDARARGVVDQVTTSIAYGEAVSIRRKYAKYIRSAPDPDLISLFADMIAVHTKVYKRAGHVKCAEFAAKGGRALNGIAEFETDLSRHAALVIESLSKGKASPVQVRSPDHSDWQEVGALFQKTHVPETYLTLVAGKDYRNPEYCPALIAILEAVQSLEGPSGHRVRAEFAVQLMAQ